MPIYEYECRKCGRRTEVIQRVSERPFKICPHCGGKLKKALSSPAIHFKGTGWYVTDYARAKRENKTEAAEKKEATEKAEASKKEAKEKKAAEKE